MVHVRIVCVIIHIYIYISEHLHMWAITCSMCAHADPRRHTGADVPAVTATGATTTTGWPYWPYRQICSVGVVLSMKLWKYALCDLFCQGSYGNMFCMSCYVEKIVQMCPVWVVLSRNLLKYVMCELLCSGNYGNMFCPSCSVEDIMEMCYVWAVMSRELWKCVPYCIHIVSILYPC